MNKNLRSVAILSTMIICVALGYAAATHQSRVSVGLGHSEHATKTGQPSEVGQATFAAIAEIVALLANNPDTDWQKVNIDQLRNHLVDMNAITLNAKVEKSRTEGAVEFKVSGKGVTLRAIQAMVPAHSKELAKIPNWHVTAKKTETGAVLQIASDDHTQLTKINALGFFGLMATGAHHQPHHLGMAIGIDHLH